MWRRGIRICHLQSVICHADELQASPPCLVDPGKLRNIAKIRNIYRIAKKTYY